ncbi:MAG: hypothetical protein IKW03_07265 [Clostridia bacterium]|nr:hypothetical protein [Clostridia bacterium]
MSYFVCVRFSIFIVILTICIFLINTRMQPEKRIKAIIGSVLICSFVCFTVLWFIPFENSFLSFSTAQEAYSYYSNDDVEIMIEGSDTCLIVANNKKTRQMLIFQKQEDGWKIKNGSNVTISGINSSDNTFCYLIYDSSSKDRYITISNIVKSELNISDNFGTEFFKDSQNHYYAYFEKLPDDYVLTVNGKTVEIEFK